MWVVRIGTRQNRAPRQDGFHRSILIELNAIADRERTLLPYRHFRRDDAVDLLAILKHSTAPAGHEDDDGCVLVDIRRLSRCLLRWVAQLVHQLVARWTSSRLSLPDNLFPVFLGDRFASASFRLFQASPQLARLLAQLHRLVVHMLLNVFLMSLFGAVHSHSPSSGFVMRGKRIAGEAFSARGKPVSSRSFARIGRGLS